MYGIQIKTLLQTYTAFTCRIYNEILLKVFEPRNTIEITVFSTVARLFPVISIVNYLNFTLIAGVKSSRNGNKVFNCNRTVNGL